jgi:hypothetical protein
MGLGPDGSLHQKVGEAIGLLQGVVARLDDMDGRLRERSEEARRQEDRLTIELRTVKHDQRNFEQVVAGQIELMRRDMRRLEDRATTIADNVEGLQSQFESTSKVVEAMQGPLEQLVGLRNRGAAILLAFMSFITVVWVLAEPIWQFLAQRITGSFFTGSHP